MTAPHPFRIHDTLSGQILPFVPVVPGEVGLYVCGMTVYDEAHVGHARAMVVFDAFARYLRFRGWKVKFVRNFTDIDDKIIERAAAGGEDPFALAQRYIDRFHRDVEKLGLLPPDAEPRVTQSIPAIQSMIADLIAKGHAYAAGGSVWFAVETFPTYGKLSGQRTDALRSADVGDKRGPGDFALWKGAKPGEPAWDSPWGPGRPGWHIECSAMARAELGPQIDFHGGGLDLVFPHHENEIAQSESANGCTYSRCWMHNGLLTGPGGRKMGKSEGNAVNIHTLVDRWPAEALRLYYLQSHYRSPLPWDGETAIPDALSMLARLYEAAEVAGSWGGAEDPDLVAKDLGRDALDVVEASRTLATRFFAALDEDFNTSLALSYALELARAVNRLGNHKSAKKRAGPIGALARAAFGQLVAIGLLTQSPEAFQAEVKQKRLADLGLDRAMIEAKLTERLDARAARDWPRADAIRAELDQLGIVVMDRAEGVDWRVRIS